MTTFFIIGVLTYIGAYICFRWVATRRPHTSSNVFYQPVTIGKDPVSGWIAPIFYPALLIDHHLTHRGILWYDGSGDILLQLPPPSPVEEWPEIPAAAVHP